jgi:large subunit ribosomal protein L21
MYAIIKTGGKQYKVQAGDVLKIESVDQELGAEFTIDQILMIGGEKAHVGTPTVKNAKVTAVVIKQARTKKVIVFKKKRRQGYRKFGTHKQNFTEIFVKTITSPDGQVSKSDATPEVKDMAKLRIERIEQKVADHKARVSARNSDVEEAETSPKPAKKAVKKPAAKKAAAKKAKPASKRSVKKAATTNTKAKKK